MKHKTNEEDKETKENKIAYTWVLQKSDEKIILQLS